MTAVCNTEGPIRRRKTLVVVLQHSLIESHGYTLTISLSPLVCSMGGHTMRAFLTTLNLGGFNPLVVVHEGIFQWESVES